MVVPFLYYKNDILILLSGLGALLDRLERVFL